MSCDEVVLGWLNSQNRPFSITNAVDALQSSGYKKSQITNALAALADSNRCSVLVNGKQSVYYARQDTQAMPNQTELAALGEEVAALTRSIAAQKARNAGLAGELKALATTQTTAEMQAETRKLEAASAELEERLKTLRDPSVKVPSVEESAAEDRLAEASFEMWRFRRSKVRDAMDQLLENGNTTEKQLIEDSGMETDEMCKVDWKASLALADKMRRARQMTKKPR